MRQSIHSMLSPSLAIVSGLLRIWSHTVSWSKDHRLAQTGVESAVANLAELSFEKLAFVKTETFFVASFHQIGRLSRNTITLDAVEHLGGSSPVKLGCRF